MLQPGRNFQVAEINQNRRLKEEQVMKMDSNRILGKIGMALLLLGVSTIGADRTQATPAPDDHSVLILDSTVTGGSNSLEATSAAALGFTVVVVTNDDWLAMSTNDFASFRAIILGDPTCGDLSEIDAAVSNRTVWSSVLNGNIVIIGTDPVFHQPEHPGAGTLISDGINFATTQIGKTGAYLDLSCYYSGDSVTDTVQVLDQFGTFTVTGVPCEGAVAITASHPAIASLTAADLSNWDCSVHETFVAFPNGFIVLAISLDDNKPYILAKGKGLVPGGSGCLDSAISGLGLSRSYQISLQREATIITRAVARRDFNGARANCRVLGRRVAALVRRGLISPSAADVIASCCSSL